jgi:hypothetical protein
MVLSNFQPRTLVPSIAAATTRHSALLLVITGIILWSPDKLWRIRWRCAGTLPVSLLPRLHCRIIRP